MHSLRVFLCFTFAVPSFLLPLYCQQAIPLPIPQPPDGSLGGKVVDENGRPVQGVRVYLQHFQTVVGRVQKTITKIDGTFAVPQMPSGNYASCVTVPNSDFVDECIWNLTFLPRIIAAVPATSQIAKATPAIIISDVPYGSATITIPATASALPTPQPQLSVRLGARVIIQFNDPKKLLDSKADVFVGALGPGALMVPGQKTSTPTSLTFQQVIPFDTPVTVLISSIDVLVSDSSGPVNLLKDFMVPFKVAKTDKTPVTVTFTVTGRKGK